jgi:malate dehydrogenase (oxaloacetate-decarboxylating)
VSSTPTSDARAKRAEQACRMHHRYHGKIQTMPKVPIGEGDLGIWYTPGVAAPCRAITGDPELVYEYTNKGNSVAVVTDGSRILGLGNIGPQAGLPVMEGKALLFKYLGGVDAVPICLDTQDPDEIIRTVRLLAPSFGGINLEDFAQPKCFRILDELRSTMPIPVWHDDQQGTATVALAGLINALRIVGKQMNDVKIAMIGMGAANVATFRMLRAMGIDRSQIVACDSKGILYEGREDIATDRQRFADKWRICVGTNPDQITGGIRDAMKGADVVIAFSQSGPGVILPEWVEAMAVDPIVFACANPVPEIWPADALAAGAAVVATGSSDLPNQVNNSLTFPGIFRGVLDVRARTITDEMAISAARGLAAYARETGISDQRLLPPMDDIEAAVRVAVATGVTAADIGVAQVKRTKDELYESARHAITESRAGLESLVKAGVVPEGEPVRA